MLETSAGADRFKKPMRLDVAAGNFFGADSGVTGKTLAKLGRDGMLRVYKIAGKTFTTLDDLYQMVRASAVERRPSSRSTMAHPTSTSDDAGAAAFARAQAAIEALE